MSTYEEQELAKGEDRLARGDYKGAFKALESAAFTGAAKRVRDQAVLRMRELASRTEDTKLSQKASGLADTIERAEKDAAARQAEAAAAQQRAYDERAKIEGAKRYKVLTQKDRFFAGKFDPEKLEGAINAYAEQGWRVVSIATASIPGGLNQHREEIIVLMTREPSGQNGG